MKYRVGLCKRYWKYVTVEADNENQAKRKASEIADKENEHLPSAVKEYMDYSNNIEISDVVEN